MQSSEVELKEDIIVLPISFGNPSNEIIYGELRLSRSKEHVNNTVAMIGIPTEIDLKELFAFLEKSKSSLKLSHIKILNQEDTKNTADPSESYYCLLCSFSSSLLLKQHSLRFISDLNDEYFNPQLTNKKCSIYYVINSAIIINKQKQTKIKHKEMRFPPPRLTTAELIKQNSNPINNYGADDDIANCGCCLDAVEPPFTPQQSPVNKKKKYKLFDDETSSFSSSPPPLIEDNKWYDNDNCVCFVLCGHFFHVMCLMRCEQNSCPICRHWLFPESSSICNSCSLCTKDLWVCLTCGHIGCGRFSNQCALKHYNETSHIWAKCLSTAHVWDYADDDYVYRIIMAQIINDDGNTKLVSLQTHRHDGIDGSTKHLPQELDVMSSVKQEELISEYNFVVQDRLKRLQRFHKTKGYRLRKNGENDLNKLNCDIEKMKKEIKNKNKNNDKLLSKYKRKYNNNEFVDDICYLRKQLNQERNRNDKLKKMIHRVFVEQKTFNEKLKEYENTLKQSLSMTNQTLNIEITNLKNELRDYRAHIDTNNKMQKVIHLNQDELNGAQVCVKPGKSKNNSKRDAKNKPHSNKKIKKTRKNRK